ncbi:MULTISPECIES: alpha/beta fold hydrolase [unclassified Brucella]|uniref:alpha/beta fold hydrolase n=1 Tax=Brucella amazoniensis TaxID=2837955 RepID=UPI003850DD9B
MQFAKVNDIVVHYDLRWNGNDKPVLVFINSLGTDFRIWNKVRARLGHDVSTLVYDKRGHGLSDIGKTPYTIELLAQDLIALLDRLSIHKAVIYGLSVGGLIAQGLYAARPDLVAGLVLSNTAHKIGTPEMWNARIDAIMQNGLASILDATMPRWFTAAYRRPDNAATRLIATCSPVSRWKAMPPPARPFAMRISRRQPTKFPCRSGASPGIRTARHPPLWYKSWRASSPAQFSPRSPIAATSPASSSRMPILRCCGIFSHIIYCMENE